MSVEVNNDAALRFLEFYFGEKPKHLIELTFGRPNPNEAKAKAGRDDIVNTRVYRSPSAAIESTMWQEETPRSSVWFCTSPLKTKGTHTAANAAMLPALWFDVDEGPKLEIDGEQFINWLREELDVSCWIRTSPGKAQGIFLLDEPIEFDPDDDGEEPEHDLDEMDEDELEMELTRKSKKKTKTKIDSKKAAFVRDELKPLLWKICYHVGGDERVVNLSRILRVPGSLNIKYDPPARVKGIYPAERRVFTMAELRKKLNKIDENSVPRIVFFAIAEAMRERCPEGNRHFPLLGLIGTVRRMGMDRESCRNLMDELCNYLVHESEDKGVDTTYDRDAQDEGMWTLRGEINGETFEDIVDRVEKAIKFWKQQKSKYCKYMKIKWSPENTNPLSGEVFDDALFKVKEDGTWWTNPKTDVDEKFSNFTIKMMYKVVRPGNGVNATKTVDICEITSDGSKNLFEWPADKVTDFSKFSAIPNLPSMLSVIKRDLWSVYVDWLVQQRTGVIKIETPFYGVIDVESPHPTILLPHREHQHYVLGQNAFDTADVNHRPDVLSPARAEEYLTKLARCYPTYHDPNFIWPAIGWFVSSMFSSFSRKVFNGFPILLVSGIKESGKTDLVNFVLAKHMGCQSAHNYSASTQYAKYRKLGSNNLFAMVTDEFKDKNDDKTGQLVDLVNQVWDGEMREANAIDGGKPQVKLVGSMCVVGEHEYQDPASIDRTFSIRVQPNYLQNIKNLEDAHREKLAKRARWLQDPENTGLLGSLVLEWMAQNFDNIEPMLRDTRAEVEELHPGLLRRGIGISLVIFGLKVLRLIFKENGVKFPIKLNDAVEYVYAANPVLNTNKAYGNVALKVLFHETDYVIMQGVLNNRRVHEVMYELDVEDSNIAYFDVERWHLLVKHRMKSSQSAALINSAAFLDLLKASAKSEDSAIMGFPKRHPRFPVNCVKIDLVKARDQFKVNTEGWKDTEPGTSYNE